MKIKPIENEIIKYETASCIVCRGKNGGCSLEKRTDPVYKVTPYSRVLRDLRIKNDILMRDLAMELNISSAELSGIEIGRLVITDEEVFFIKQTIINIVNRNDSN